MGVRDRVIEGLGGSTPEALAEGLRDEKVMNSVLHENLSRLELALEDQGWRRLTGELSAEFTRAGLEQIIRVSRAMYLTHPLMRRATNVTTYYTWAQGATFRAADSKVQDIIDEMMDNDFNRAELYGHQARIYTDVDQQVDGNLFVVMFTNEYGDVSVRTIPVEQIQEILTREGDSRIITFYRRVWAEDIFDERTGGVRTVQKEELYPDWRYHPDRKPESFGDIKVNWNAPIIHQRTGGLKNMKFGIPEGYSAFEWARAYKGFLEDWHTLVKSLSRFAWKGKTKGRKIQRLKEKLQQGTEQKDPEREEPSDEDLPGRRPVGDMWLGREGDDIQAIPKTGASVSADDARPSRLMVASAVDLPDTFLSGDVDIGNFATSKTLDRPTELGFKNRQALWTSLDSDIFRYVIDAKVRAMELPGKSDRDTRTGMNLIVPGVDPTVSITFPPILEDDKKANVSAIAAAATLEGRASAGTLPEELTSKLLLEALGVEDVDQALKDLPEEEAEQVAEALERLREAIDRNS
jgi:hypothetical protein